MLFLAYQLSCHAKQHVSYIGNPKLMNNVMAEIQLSMPDDINEQTNIAKNLSTLDQAIEQTEAIIAKQQRIKTGMVQDLLTKGIDENGNIRSEATHEFKDSMLGRIPMEWEVARLETVCDKIQDGTHFSPKTDSSAKFKYLTSRNIRFGFLDLSSVDYIDEKQHKEIYKRCSVRKNDVLLTKGLSKNKWNKS